MRDNRYPPVYDLSLEEAIPILEKEAEKNEAQQDTPQLQGMTPDQAYNVGYATAIHDLLSVTGPNPTESGIEILRIKPVEEEDSDA